MSDRAGYFERGVGFVSSGLLGLAGIFTLLMMIHTVIDVGVRFFLDFALPGTIDIVGYYYMIGSIMLGLAATELSDGQIRVESIDQLMPPLYKRVSLIFGKIITSVFMGILAYGAVLRLGKSYQTNEVTFGHHVVTLWPSRLIFFIGIGGVLVAAAWRIWRITRHDEDVDPTAGGDRMGPL
ncbi:TRAP transporter small permease [Roseovarius aestuarii]|nr:TRAP transporter small permease [Roseovarius aestuarii]